MDGILQILALAAFLSGGAILARLRLAPPARLVDRLIKLVLWALLFVMGFRIGNDRAIAARLGEIGLLALASAALSVAGTVAAVLAGYALIGLWRGPKGGARRAAKEGAAEGAIAAATPIPAASVASAAAVRDVATPTPTASIAISAAGRSAPGSSPGRLERFKAPALLLGIVVLGFFAGLALPAAGFDFSKATGATLNALLFLIGAQFVQSGVSLKGAFLKPETLMTPLATALGSLAGGLLLVPLFGLSAGKALSLSAGFGWYSLSGVLIADLGDGALGSAAFLANMARESIAFLAIPLLARGRFPSLAIGVGGATAMDVTLPLVEQCAGPEAVPASFASGALLSLSVPLLVPLFFKLG